MPLDHARRSGQKKRSAGVEAELDVCIQHVPFCVAVGDELADVAHHHRLSGIGVKKPDGRIEPSLGGAQCLLRRVFASKTANRSIAETFLERTTAANPTPARRPRAGSAQLVMRSRAGHSECCFQTEEDRRLERAPKREVDALAPNDLVMTILQHRYAVVAKA